MNAPRMFHHHPSRRLASVGLVAAAALVVAACGSSKSSTTAATSGTTATTAAGSAAGVTIKAANVAPVGTVLVNGDGKTLYLLSSEKGGKLTCTDDNGCTKIWPDTELPAGVTAATAGAGVQASMLGTVKGSSGSLYVTYAGWPLYTFANDPGPGTANGEGIVSFGGTWMTLNPAGTPVQPAGSSSTTSKPYG